jgi:hypothetical protein
MSEERARILRMISEGQITAEDGVRLINALRSAESSAETRAREGGRARWFRVRVTDMETGRVKVNVNLPLSLVNVATKMGARFSPEMQDFDWDALMASINEGASGKLIEVEDDAGGERVEVFVE